MRGCHVRGETADEPGDPPGYFLDARPCQGRGPGFEPLRPLKKGGRADRALPRRVVAPPGPTSAGVRDIRRRRDRVGGTAHGSPGDSWRPRPKRDAVALSPPADSVHRLAPARGRGLNRPGEIIFNETKRSSKKRHDAHGRRPDLVGCAGSKSGTGFSNARTSSPLMYLRATRAAASLSMSLRYSRTSNRARA